MVDTLDISYGPSPNSLDIEYPTEKFKLILLEHSEINSFGGISSIHRQDVRLEDILDSRI